jgi:hypothetical protein
LKATQTEATRRTMQLHASSASAFLGPAFWLVSRTANAAQTNRLCGAERSRA